VNNKYVELRGHDLAHAIHSETSGNYQHLLTAIVTHPKIYWANRIHHAIRGLGTNDELLRRAFVLNNQCQLLEIQQIYPELHKHTLEEDVAGDTSFNYKKTLLALLIHPH